MLVKSKKTSKLYALKSIVKEHVIQQREITHTLDEKNILSIISKVNHPYLAKLHLSFQDEHRLYLLTNYYSGGDLATQMTRFYKFPPEYALFYAAEIIEGISELHRFGILYRDLKPENILLTNDGHVVLTDFGLSKCLTESNNNYKTSTFCGTAEYLAPEVLLGEDYSFAVDYWSFGTILFEMLAGVPPFWDENHDDMYQRIIGDPLCFPPENFSPEARDLLSNILDRDPRTRLGAGSIDEIKGHAYFVTIDWDDLANRQLHPPYNTPLVRDEGLDFSNFDPEFISMSPVLTQISSENEYSVELHDTFDGYSFVDTDFYKGEPLLYNRSDMIKSNNSTRDNEASSYDNSNQRQKQETINSRTTFPTLLMQDVRKNNNNLTEYPEPTTPTSDNQNNINNETNSFMNFTAFDYLDFLQSPDLRLSFQMDQEYHVVKDDNMTPVSVRSSITNDIHISRDRNFFTSFFS